METLFCLAVNNAVAAVLLAAIVAVLTRFCRRPAVRHALWLLVLLKLITPPLVPLSVNWPRTEGIEPPLAESPPSTVDLAPVSEPMEPIAPLSESPQPIAAPEADSPSFSPTLADVWLSLLMTVWLGGSLTWWTIAAVRLRKFQRLLRQARPAPVEVREQARRLAALLGLRRCPSIIFVSAPLSPMLWALGFSPRLLLPAELWRNLGTEQQDTLLAHELAHLRRGDHWVRRLEFVVLGLYWWHPVVWWARRRLQEAEEECCDALVVAVLPDAASAYASALIETVAFLSQARAAAFVGASGAGQVPLLKRRLTMILNANPSRRPSRAAFWAVLGLGALLLPLAPGAARTQAPVESKGVETKDRPVALDFDLPIIRMDHAKPLADTMRTCASCHEPVPVQGHDLQRLPQWREAHDEIIRLMDEVRRLQAQLGESAKRPPPVIEGNRREQIEKMQDEIELLRLQVRLKETRLRRARTPLPLAQKRMEGMQKQSKAYPGSIPSDDLMAAEDTVATLTAEVEIKEVELQEARLLLKQAERRFARLQRPAEGTDGTRAQQEKRLRELEQKMESLLKEIRDLRREMKPKKPDVPGRSANDPSDDWLWKKVGLRLRPVGGDVVKRTMPQFRGGLMITEVRPDSPAQRSGLQHGDILVGLHKFETLSDKDVHYVLNQSESAGVQPLKFYVLRNNQLQDGKFQLGE